MGPRGEVGDRSLIRMLARLIELDANRIYIGHWVKCVFPYYVTGVLLINLTDNCSLYYPS